MAISPKNQARAARKKLHHNLDSKHRLESDYLAEYCKLLLPLELECARSDHENPQRLPPEHHHGCTLVLLVGFSLEPLLQSIAVYRPAKVCLVVKAEYTERVRGETLASLIRDCVQQFPPELALPEIEWIEITLTADQPVHVFERLRQRLVPLLRTGERMVVDITGGKKSMIVGAFLFGAFTDVPISYVDFDEYDVENRVPWGYTCRIGELENPYRAFRLKDWTQVRELYHKHFFRNAGILLGEILPSMDSWFRKEEIEAARRLREALKVYESWDNGDFSTAYRLGSDLGFRLPTAADVLGRNGYWPHRDGADTLLNQLSAIEVGANSIYRAYEKLSVYVFDELGKVRRLIEFNEDWRSALLRAVGLTEVLVRARVVFLLDNNHLDFASAKGCEYVPFDKLSQSMRDDIENKVTKTHRRFRDNFFRGDPDYQVLGKDQGSLRCRPGAPVTAEACIVLKDERDLRNKATHTFLCIPQEVAEKVLAIAEASAREFFDEWLRFDRNGIEGIVSWKEICLITGVDFLAESGKENVNAMATGG